MDGQELKLFCYKIRTNAAFPYLSMRLGAIVLGPAGGVTEDKVTELISDLFLPKSEQTSILKTPSPEDDRSTRENSSSFRIAVQSDFAFLLDIRNLKG
jgi:hypothetical protein